MELPGSDVQCILCGHAAMLSMHLSNCNLSINQTSVIAICLSPLPHHRDCLFLTTTICVSHNCRPFLTTDVCFSPLPSVSHHCRLLLESICILPDMRSQYLNHVKSYLLSDWSDSEVFYHYCSDQVHAGCQDTRQCC